MKRYIRTKDGRIYDTEVNGAWEQTNGIIGIPTFDCIVKIPQDFITKQADTIEELCDEFVIVDEKINQHTIVRKEALLLFKPTPTWALYGSIWVDKNLIKVAKMNEKGELELL